MNHFIGNSIDDYRLAGLWMHIAYGCIAGRLVDSRNLLSRLDGLRDLLLCPTTRPHLLCNLSSYSCTAA